MSVTWKYIKPLKKKAVVKDFLANNHIVLPAKLLRILENNNGGRPSDKTIITDTKREYVFKSLLSFNSDDKEYIAKFYNRRFIENCLFPVGSDAAGNFVCYNTKTHGFVLYNHETDKTEKIVKMAFL